MHAHPGSDPRLTRVLAWLTALAALSLCGFVPARAAEATDKAAPPAKSAEPVAKAAPPVVSKSVETVAKPSGTPKTSSAPADSNMTLQGGKERTDFRTMTVEGEDRVHVVVERPSLLMDMDPSKVSGLESGSAADVLNRVAPDLSSGYMSITSHQPMPYMARPWLRQFTSGAVARFQPAVKGVTRWKLMVADSKGQTVMTYSGSGDPPKDIPWDGRTQGGALVTPGLTYSYVFEAYDKAGNKRNFVGEGFKVAAYRVETPNGPVLVFSGSSLVAPNGAAPSMGMGNGARATSPIVAEAAMWLNQSSRVMTPVRVTATARGYDQANLLAKQVGAALGELTLGDPARIQTVAEVVPDAPDGGMVRVGFAVGPDPVGPQSSVMPEAEKSPKAKGKEASKKGKK